MDNTVMYCIDDIGCYADGTFGNDYVSLKTIRLAVRCMEDCHYPLNDIRDMHEVGYGAEREVSLIEDMAKDAIDILNKHCAPGVQFVFHEGDLILEEIEDLGTWVL